MHWLICKQFGTRSDPTSGCIPERKFDEKMFSENFSRRQKDAKLNSMQRDNQTSEAGMQ